MTLEKSKIEVTPGTERNFGIVFAVVFGLIGLYPLLQNAGVRWWCMAIALAFVLGAILRPALFEKPNYWWFRLGMLLGAIVAPVVMGVVYFLTIVPTGLLVRVSGKDLLKLKLDREADSYWVEREQPMQPMQRQF